MRVNWLKITATGGICLRGVEISVPYSEWFFFPNAYSAKSTS